MVYKRCFAHPLELLSTAGFRAYPFSLPVGPTGNSAGLNPGPWMGFKSYSGRGGPVGGIIFFPCFLFSLLLYLFCFVSTYNKKLIYFILFCF